MIRRLVYLSIATLAMQAFYITPDDVAAGAESTSSKRIDGCRIEEGGAYNALAEISQKAHIVIGVDAVQPEKEPTITLDFPGGTVADLLNAFTAQAPDYRWAEIDGGIIHVFRNHAHVSLTDVVMSYPGANDRTREEIWEDLAKRPEVEAWMNSNRCSRGELFNGKEFRRQNDPISIAPGSLTVAQLLDAVAVKSGVNYWAVLQSPPRKPCQVYVILW